VVQDLNLNQKNVSAQMANSSLRMEFVLLNAHQELMQMKLLRNVSIVNMTALPVKTEIAV
jgi:hypothetical protein